jgi:hypothetical protein
VRAGRWRADWQISVRPAGRFSRRLTGQHDVDVQAYCPDLTDRDGLAERELVLRLLTLRGPHGKRTSLVIELPLEPAGS